MSTSLKRPAITQFIRRAVRNLLDIEMASEREIKWRKYSDLLSDIGARLRLDPRVCTPLNLNCDRPPDWIVNEPELFFVWSRSRLAFLELQEQERKSAERRQLFAKSA